MNSAASLGLIQAVGCLVYFIFSGALKLTSSLLARRGLFAFFAEDSPKKEAST